MAVRLVRTVGRSSSWTLIETVISGTFLYSSSGELWVRVTASSSVSSSSCAAVTSTVLGTFQSPGVKVRVSGDTEMAVFSWPVMSTVTSDSGSAWSRTVYVWVSPSRTTVLAGEVMIPLGLPSRVVICTGAMSSALYPHPLTSWVMVWTDSTLAGSHSDGFWPLLSRSA